MNSIGTLPRNTKVTQEVMQFLALVELPLDLTPPTRKITEDYYTMCLKNVSYSQSAAFAVAVPSNATEPHAEERRYLFQRLTSALVEKDTELRKKFHLLDDDRPRTLNDLTKRLSEKKYVIRKGYEDLIDGGEYGNDLPWSIDYLSDFLRWRDPAVKEDKKGYNEAKSALTKRFDAALDTIKILTPAEGLKALQEFEAS